MRTVSAAGEDAHPDGQVGDPPAGSSSVKRGRRRFWLINGVLLVVVALVALAGADTIFHKASASSAVRTATVTTGTVSSSVSATGNVSPAVTENVQFATGGTVTAVNVALGQRVTAGQVLAKLDPSAAQASLTAAEDDLTAAQDNLTLAKGGGETPPQQAQDQATVAEAEAQVSTAQTSLTTANQQLATDQAGCPAGTTVASAATDPAPSGGTGRGGSTGSTGSSTPSTTVTTTPTTCGAISGDKQAVTQAQNNLTQAQNSLTQAQLSVQAKTYVNPATILQDDAQVSQAQETVNQDQKTMSETTLTAPISGTVTVVNGVVGQTVSGGGSSAASSSGTGSSGGGSGTGGGTGAAAAATGTSGSSTSSASSSSSSSSSTFLTIANTSDLQVVAGFAEADATKIAVGQPATVTFSALTNTSASGRVTAVSPVSTVVSNVVTYNVTIQLINPPSTVKSGMTTNVSVVVASASNVLELPTSAITTTGRVSTVALLKNGKKTTQTVTTGLVGDTTTQISSGLSAGEVVVQPSVTVSSGTGTTGTGTTGTGRTGVGGGLGGLFGGGGGGGLGARGGG